MTNSQFSNSTAYTLISVTILFCLAGVGWAAPEIAAGQVTQVSEGLTVSGYAATAGTTLVNGDVLATGSSPVVLSLSDGRQITISSNSQVRLDVNGTDITVVTLSGNVYESTGAEASLTNDTVVALSQGSQEYQQGNRPSPKGPPFDPPEPPPETPPFEPPGPPPPPPGTPPGQN